MFSHEPAGYTCPFCALISGSDLPDPYSKQADIIYENDHVVAWVSSHWWEANAGHVILVPRQHLENIYQLDGTTGYHLAEATRVIAIAIRSTYGCTGLSTRQHNEPDGNQEVWHFHQHIFPRYKDDHLYEMTPFRRTTTIAERAIYVERLKAFLNSDPL